MAPQAASQLTSQAPAPASDALRILKAGTYKIRQPRHEPAPDERPDWWREVDRMIAERRALRGQPPA
jgi:hypothetical protein